MKLSRRELLKLSAGGAALLTLGGRLAWAGSPEASELIRHAIPSSGEKLPAIGVGMRNYRTEWAENGLGEYRRTIEVFHELGGRVLDTAPSYGDSESVLGGILDDLGIRDDFFIATKVDREGRKAGIDRMEASMDKIGTDHVELMQVHNLRDAATQLETMRRWRDEGRIRYVGITTSFEGQYEDFERVMKNEELDFIQVDYSLGNRNAAQRILPLARDRGVATLINLPFGRGKLFEAVGDRELPEWAREFDVESWAQFFLKYVISHPAVTVAIPGMTQPKHARDNAGAMRGRLPDQSERERMEQLFDSL